MPRNEQDLFIAANNGYVLAFDNLSWLPEWLSDGLSRIATEGSFATRMLYTDDEERLFTAMRPILLNGVEDVVVKGDLADRMIALELQIIPDKQRRREREFWKAFEADRAQIFGALLGAVRTACGNCQRYTWKRCRAWRTLPNGRSPVVTACCGAKVHSSQPMQRTGAR